MQVALVDLGLGNRRSVEKALERVGATVERTVDPDRLASADGLVLPGGESSVIDKLSRTFGVREPIRERIAGGMPVYGTCAGLIQYCPARRGRAVRARCTAGVASTAS